MADAKGKIHPMVAEPEPFRDSGKDIHQVNPPIVSVAPNTGNVQSKSDNHVFVDNALDNLFDDTIHVKGPFNDLKIGQGVFVPNEQNQTTDKALSKTHKIISKLREQYSEIETNDDGDEILDQVIISTRKRNDDGTIQLENDKPVVGANSTNMPRRIYYRNFIAKAVTKDQELSDSQKASADGVFVIRVL